MNKRMKIAVVTFVVFVLVGISALVSTLRHGFSALDEPTAIEVFAARSMRHWAVPAALRNAKNPVSLTSDVLAEARAHFADHCAVCHGNDGKGENALGMKMYHRAPDMTLPATQSMSDGEIFGTIENGIRLTGMPGFGKGTTDSAYGSWTLVHFIRHLPKLTVEEIEEMEALNPKSPEEWKALKEEEEFLSGGDTEEGAAAEPQPQPQPQPPHH